MDVARLLSGDVSAMLVDPGKLNLKQQLHNYFYNIISVGLCLVKLYIMAFTSDLKYAGSDGQHNVEVRIKGMSQHRPLYNRPGDDYKRNKGDFWEYSFSDFGFTDSCIQIGDFRYIEITEGGNDGWNIASIVTLVEDSSGGVQVVTTDIGVNRWIDGDGKQEHRRFRLTGV